MIDDQTNPEHVRGIFDTTLHDEPPLVDMVSGAVEGARIRKHRDRLAMVVAPTAVLAIAVAAYTVLPRFGSNGSNHTAAPSPTSSRPVFPPVADSEPLNATPAVHAAALKLCTKDWSNAVAGAGNMLPATQAEAVDMCTMEGETLMTLLPDAAVSLPDAGAGSLANGPGEQWQIKTASGKTILGIRYLWPDGTYEKKNYGPFDECGPNPVNNPTQTLVPGPNGTPFPMHDLNAGHDEACLQTRPAPQFYGALTYDKTTGGIWYSVVNHGYGRYLIGNDTPQITTTVKPTQGSYGSDDGGKTFLVDDPNAGSALTQDGWTKLLTDPRFSDFLTRYEMYVLMHGTPQSFVVSGSKPLS